MTATRIARSFDRFWRAAERARASGGDVGLARRVGGGLVATVRLPAVD
jgi:hypothetical protein